jgi:hypothetical protein
MDRRNTLYYAAAAGTILVFIIALIGLATCSNGGTTGASPQEQAVVNAYQQGYVDGYSKGYSEGFTAGMQSDVASPTASTRASSGCCPVVTPATVNSTILEAAD